MTVRIMSMMILVKKHIYSFIRKILHHMHNNYYIHEWRCLGLCFYIFTRFGLVVAEVYTMVGTVEQSVAVSDLHLCSFSIIL